MHAGEAEPECCAGVFLDCQAELGELARAALEAVPAGIPADVYDLAANEFLGMVNPPRSFLRETGEGFELRPTDEIRQMLSPESFPDLVAMLRECLEMGENDLVEKDIVYYVVGAGHCVGHHICRPIMSDRTGKVRLILDQVVSNRIC